ncbi:hypothetical protein GQR36_22340 [Enterococcus termitis]
MEQKELNEEITEIQTKRTVRLAQLFISTIWFCLTGFILISYLTNSLDEFYVPQIIGWLYDLVGILPASIIQLTITLVGICTSFPKRK